MKNDFLNFNFDIDKKCVPDISKLYSYNIDMIYPIKLNLSRGGGGKRRVFGEDGRAAEGRTRGRLGIFILEELNRNHGGGKKGNIIS